MPELPDVSVYVDAIAARVVGHRLERVTIAKPFLLRSFAPSPQELAGRVVREVRRLGKRIAIGVEGELWLVLHLMIAGRLHWYAAGKARKQRAALATFDFDNGSLTLTEAGTKRRASLYVVAGAPALAAHDPGGLEVADALAEHVALGLGGSGARERARADPEAGDDRTEGAPDEEPDEQRGHVHAATVADPTDTRPPTRPWVHPSARPSP